MFSEPLRRLNVLEERLVLLKQDNKLGIRRLFVNNPEIPDYKKRELILYHTLDFNANIRHYEEIIRRIQTIRQFYFDVADEDVWCTLFKKFHHLNLDSTTHPCVLLEETRNG